MLGKRALHIPIHTLMKQYLAVTLAALSAQQVNTCNGRAHKFGSVTPDQNTRPRAAKKSDGDEGSRRLPSILPTEAGTQVPKTKQRTSPSTRASVSIKRPSIRGTLKALRMPNFTGFQLMDFRACRSALTKPFRRSKPVRCGYRFWIDHYPDHASGNPR